MIVEKSFTKEKAAISLAIASLLGISILQAAEKRVLTAQSTYNRVIKMPLTPYSKESTTIASDSEETWEQKENDTTTTKRPPQKKTLHAYLVDINGDGIRSRTPYMPLNVD